MPRLTTHYCGPHGRYEKDCKECGATDVPNDHECEDDDDDALSGAVDAQLLGRMEER